MSESLKEAEESGACLQRDLDAEILKRGSEQPKMDIVNELVEKLNNLTVEKSSIQQKLDESQVALSTSQVAQEQGKENLRAYETKLDESYEENHALKQELSELGGALSELKEDYE